MFYKIEISKKKKLFMAFFYMKKPKNGTFKLFLGFYKRNNMFFVMQNYSILMS